MKKSDMKTKWMIANAITFALLVMKTVTVNAQTVMVGGEQMYPKKNIIENAVNSKAHTTLVAAVKAADLVTTLQGKGPFTVFAPVNDAFENLPAGTVETLLKPESKTTLTKVLTYHVIAGNYNFDALSKAIKTGGGKSVLKTVSGGNLTFMMNGEHNITVMDEAGTTATISTYDVNQSNGVIQVIDKVLMPKM
ncbi:MAG TPA: fasciclin domain-containing protein [Bacteroidia bacterium]|nr:fasciclin domain-containing protein [Bacteroidia bacterium]